jgi:hypothetical protein
LWGNNRRRRSTTKASDGDTRKSFRLIECDDVAFRRKPDGTAEMEIFFLAVPSRNFESEIYELAGNCYCMNESGKVIAAFGFEEIPRQHRPTAFECEDGGTRVGGQPDADPWCQHCPKCSYVIAHDGKGPVCQADDCHYSTRPSRYGGRRGDDDAARIRKNFLAQEAAADAAAQMREREFMPKG